MTIDDKKPLIEARVTLAKAAPFPDRRPSKRSPALWPS